jgi:hypothetical protein
MDNPNYNYKLSAKSLKRVFKNKVAPNLFRAMKYSSTASNYFKSQNKVQQRMSDYQNQLETSILNQDNINSIRGLQSGTPVNIQINNRLTLNVSLSMDNKLQISCTQKGWFWNSTYVLQTEDITGDDICGTKFYKMLTTNKANEGKISYFGESITRSMEEFEKRDNADNNSGGKTRNFTHFLGSNVRQNTTNDYLQVLHYNNNKKSQTNTNITIIDGPNSIGRGFDANVITGVKSLFGQLFAQKNHNDSYPDQIEFNLSGFSRGGCEMVGAYSLFNKILKGGIDDIKPSRLKEKLKQELQNLLHSSYATSQTININWLINNIADQIKYKSITFNLFAMDPVHGGLAHIRGFRDDTRAYTKYLESPFGKNSKTYFDTYISTAEKRYLFDLSHISIVDPDSTYVRCNVLHARHDHLARLHNENRGENNLVQTEFEKFIGVNDKYFGNSSFQNNEIPLPESSEDLNKHRLNLTKEITSKRLYLHNLYQKITNKPK